jgi:hypothetical protein
MRFRWSAKGGIYNLDDEKRNEENESGFYRIKNINAKTQGLL